MFYMFLIHMMYDKQGLCPSLGRQLVCSYFSVTSSGYPFVVRVSLLVFVTGY